MKEEEEISTHSNEHDGEIENVRVVVRVRPMDKLEIDSGFENVVKANKLNRCITVIKRNAPVSEPPKMYYFDNVFGEDSTQVRVPIRLSCFYISIIDFSFEVLQS